MLWEMSTTPSPWSASRRTRWSTCSVWATPERGRRLVEDDDLAVPQHRLGDGHRLALATGEAGDDLADALDRPHLQAGEHVPGAALHGPLVEDPGLAQLAAEEHVLDDVEVVAQGEVLVDDLDAEGGGGPRSVDGDRLVLEGDLPAVDGVDAGDALDQRRLAGTVVAHQRGDLTRIDGEVDVMEHLDGAEALVDPGQDSGWGSPTRPLTSSTDARARRTGTMTQSWDRWARPGRRVSRTGAALLCTSATLLSGHRPVGSY